MGEEQINQQETGIVVAAGGASSRFGPSSKLTQMLLDRPVVIHTLQTCLKVVPSEHIVLVVPRHETGVFRELLDTHLPGHQIVLCPGGNTRMDSVCNGLDALPAEVKYVAVHDAARPLTTVTIFEAVIDQCIHCGGAVAAKRTHDTVKMADHDNMVRQTLDRRSIWTVQTPQVFPLNELRHAYQAALAADRQFTDDASVMEFSGKKVKLVDTSTPNLKITFPGDLELAAVYLQAGK